jgi:uncharacterized protein YpmB
MLTKKLILIGGLTILTAGIIGVGIYMTKRPVQVAEKAKEEISEGPITGLEEIRSTPKIDTSAWKIYRNEEYKFRVKYPDNFVAEQANNTIYFHPLEPNPSVFYPSIMILDETLEERVQALRILFKISTSPFSEVISDRKITLNDRNGRELIFRSEIGHEIRYVLLAHNSKTYQWEVDNFDVEGLRNIFSEMLSTFEFVE